jgi:SagB-type dehydrogenase family enzyme
MSRRRSIRQYHGGALELEQIGQLLWAAQGVTSSLFPYRAAPSAGALYPLELYVATGAGAFHYRPRSHELAKLGDSDLRPALRHAALDQSYVEGAPCVVIVTGVNERTTRKYGERGLRYVLMEAGHAAQNLLLQAAALGLGAVPVGAFEDQPVSRLLNLGKGEHPLYLIPVGSI